MRRGPARWIITSLFVLVLFEVVGTRGLLGRSLPGVGQFQPFPSPSVLLRHSFSGWRTTGLGSTAFAPPAFVMLALSGYALLGSMQLLQKLLVIGMIPIGLIGVWRLARHLSDQREDDTTTADPSEASAASRIAVGVRVVAILAYAALPLPYESLAKGNWRGLIAYGAMPWLFRSLIRAAETQPLVRLARRSTAQTERQLAHFRLGLLLAMATAFVPEMPLVIGVSAASLSLGSCLIREARGRWSPLSSAAAATLLSVVLLAPWSVQMLRRPTGSGLLPGSRFAPESGSATVIDLLAFHHGSVGIRSLGIGLSVSALSPLLLASGRRLEWAIRFWLVIVVCTALAWVTGRGWLGGGITTTDVLLVPAGLSVALCVALGAAGFAIDLRGHRFGWRQSLISVSIVAVVLGGVPSIWAARGGRWGMPKRDVAAKLGWMAPEPRGPYRTLWVGRPTALPVEGWPLAKGLVYATTRNGLPTVLDSWPGPALGGTPEIARAMNLMRAQGTTRVGRLLAPMAILYVVVWGGNSASNVAESEVTDGLRTQLDLSQVGGVDDVLIYKNEAWAPGIVALSGTAQELSRSADVNAATLVDLSSSPSALAVHRSETDVDGSLSTESVIALSESYSARWHLRSAGNEPVGRRSFGWATAFDLRPSPTPMPAELRYDPPNLRGVLLIAQIGLWFVCLVVWRRLRRRLPARISPETVSLTDWTDDGEADSGDSPVDTDPFADGFEPEGRLADELWQTFARRRNTTNRQRATSQRDDEVESSR